MAFHNLWVCEQRAVSSQGVSVLLGLPGVLSPEQLLTGAASVGFNVLHLKSIYSSSFPGPPTGEEATRL